jgi:hypothetical protein
MDGLLMPSLTNNRFELRADFSRINAAADIAANNFNGFGIWFGWPMAHGATDVGRMLSWNWNTSINNAYFSWLWMDFQPAFTALYNYNNGAFPPNNSIANIRLAVEFYQHGAASVESQTPRMSYQVGNYGALGPYGNNPANTANTNENFGLAFNMGVKLGLGFMWKRISNLATCQVDSLTITEGNIRFGSC